MTDVNIFCNGIAVEGLNTTLTFTIELSAPATTNTTYYYSTFSNTAIAGSDFTAATNTAVTFLAGERVKTISILNVKRGLPLDLTTKKTHLKSTGDEF